MDSDVVNAFNYITAPTLSSVSNVIRYKPPQSIKQWGVLFEYYNANHENKIGMGCTPCYFKVYDFIKKQISA